MIGKFEIEIEGFDKLEGELKKLLRPLENAEVTAGIYGKKDAAMVIIAAANEFGTDSAGRNHSVKIPARSFMRSTFDEKFDEIYAYVNKQIASFLEKAFPIETVLERAGLKLQTLIQDKIRSNIQPKNAPATLKAYMSKGKNRTAAGKRTLIGETGDLLKSISYEVKK
jgi:hypothetical protein